MNLETLPLLSLTSEPTALARDLGSSFEQFGFALVTGHGLDPALVQRAWTLTEALFALPEAEKRASHIAGQGGARGYTPFGTEIAKGAAAHDLKEFWHIGRDLPGGHPLSASMPPNVWPAHPAQFRETFTALYDELDRVGAAILTSIAVGLEPQELGFEPQNAEYKPGRTPVQYPAIPE